MYRIECGDDEPLYRTESGRLLTYDEVKADLAKRYPRRERFPAAGTEKCTPEELAEWRQLESKTSAELVEAELHRLPARFDTVRQHLEDSNIIVPVTQAGPSEEALRAVADKFSKHIEPVQLAAHINAWNAEGPPFEAAKKLVARKYQDQLSCAHKCLRDGLIAMIDMVTQLQTATTGLYLSSEFNLADDRLVGDYPTDDPVIIEVGKAAGRIRAKRRRVLRHYVTCSNTEGVPAIAQALSENVSVADYIRQLLTADREKVRSYLKIAGPLSKTAGSSSMEVLYRSMKRVKADDTPAALLKVLEKSKYPPNRGLQLAVGDLPYIPDEHAEVLKSVLASAEDIKLFRAMIADQEWSSDAAELVSEEALLGHILRKRDGDADRVAAIVSLATEAAEVKALACRKLAAKSVRIHSLGRAALSVDWDKELEDVE